MMAWAESISHETAATVLTLLLFPLFATAFYMHYRKEGVGKGST